MNIYQLRAFATGLFGTSLVALVLVLAGREPAAGSTRRTFEDLPASAALAGVPGSDAELEVDTAADAEEVASTPEWIEHKILKGETLGRILPAFGAPVQAVLDAASAHTNLSSIRAGEVLAFHYEGDDPVPVSIRYPMGEDRTLYVERSAVGWTSRMDEVVYESHLARRTLTVTQTLWGAAVEAGLRPRDVAAIASVFEFDLDFNSELRAGATLEVVIEELWSDGEPAKLGTPFAARLVNAGKTYVAIRHELADGKAAYYDENGISRRRAFLRSPIAYGKVTSGFNLKRFHPVLKKSRPHYGVDFGAPTGTPVRAVGDGVVTFAGRSGGHGNFVKIDHEGPYETSYSHLSKINVKKGQRIKQGELVGKVGTTGMSTGPHLHYQLWVNGKYKNPLTVELPRNIELPQAELARFKATRSKWLAVLDQELDPSDLDPGAESEGAAVADASDSNTD